MKTYALLVALLCCAFLTTTAQTKTYEVNGTSYDLKTDVSGPLTLLWTSVNQDFKYFVLKDGEISELKNKNESGVYNDDYIKTLKQLTSDASMNYGKVRFTLASLRGFVNSYNNQVDSTYEDNSTLTNIEYRLGVFGGVTNHIFTENPNNASTPQLGLEFELYDPVALPSHAIVFQIDQTLKSDDFRFSSTQFSLSHRLKFIKSSLIDVYLNTKLVTVTSGDRDEPLVIEVPDGEDITIRDGGTKLEGPIIFGLGADIKVGKGFIMLQYQDAVSLVKDTNGEFPVDVSVGYKIAL